MLIAWMVMKVKYISLVNLIMEKQVVTELKQYDLNQTNLYNEAIKILPESDQREEMLANFVKLKVMLCKKGPSERVGAKIVSILNQEPTSNID